MDSGAPECLDLEVCELASAHVISWQLSTHHDTSPPSRNQPNRGLPRQADRSTPSARESAPVRSGNRLRITRINQSSTSAGPDLHSWGPRCCPRQSQRTQRYECSCGYPKLLDQQTRLPSRPAGETCATEPGCDLELHRRWLLAYVRSHGGIGVRSSRAGRRLGGRRLRPQSGA